MKIISGGQTGVDRAALDVAIELGIPYYGYCPKGRKAEDGRIPDRYDLLTELESRDYATRTRANVKMADAVLVLVDDSKDYKGGTLLTLHEAKHLGKATNSEWLLDDEIDIAAVRFWVHNLHRNDDIMIAGPRESKRPGIYERAKKFLAVVLKQ